MNKNFSRMILFALLIGLGHDRAVVGQTAPWITFTDDLSESVCDVINTENSELVLLVGSGELVVVTGRDVVLEETFVDANDNVFFGGEPAGFLNFEDDGAGLRSLWWVSLNGRAIGIDGFSGEPIESASFPSDFFSVGCDACEFWDDRFLCASLNDPSNGAEDDPVIDPETPQAPVVDLVFNLCGLNSGATMGLIFLSLGAARWRRRSAGASGPRCWSARRTSRE